MTLRAVSLLLLLGALSLFTVSSAVYLRSDIFIISTSIPSQVEAQSSSEWNALLFGFPHDLVVDLNEPDQELRVVVEGVFNDWRDEFRAKGYALRTLQPPMTGFYRITLTNEGDEPVGSSVRLLPTTLEEGRGVEWPLINLLNTLTVVFLIPGFATYALHLYRRRRRA